MIDPVIVFGCPILHEEVYERFARASIDALSDPAVSVIEKRGYDSIQEPYNEILEEAAQQPELEAVVLLHEDTTVDEPALPDVIRWHMRDPALGVLGAVGARGVTGIDWWNGATAVGSAATPKISADTVSNSVGPQLADAVDGYLMIVSPAVARRVRFDERGKRDFHGYDVDFCFRVRAAGYKVVVDDIRTGHYSLGGDPEDGSWARAAAAWRRTWDPERWDPAWRGSAPYGFFR